MAQTKSSPQVTPAPDGLVSVGEHKYLVKRLNTFDQFEIARKLAPVLSMLAMQKDQSTLADRFPQAFCALTAGLDQADMDRINKLVLSAVSREQQGHFVPIYVGGMLAFDDIGMLAMLQLFWAVLEAARLPDFFAGGLSVLENLRT